MLNEKIKEVLISTVDFREFEPVPIIIRLNVKEGMGKHEIITAIRSACKEFCDKKKLKVKSLPTKILMNKFLIIFVKNTELQNWKYHLNK